MLKYLLSLFSISVLLLPSVLLPAGTAACPVKEPETLLSLYRHSDAIYVARFDKIEDAEIVENTDERPIVNIKKYFDVSSALKGETRKLFVLEEKEYRYKLAEVTSAESSEDSQDVELETEEESPFGAPNLESGDLLLLFVKKGEDGKTFELTDYRDAIKKMTPQRLESYEARIRELNSIFSGKKVDHAAIVEWLVRCTQDPATRWEGAYQFQKSFQLLKWLEEQKQEEQENEGSDEESAGSDVSKTENVENNEVEHQADTESEELASGEEDQSDDSLYASLLSDAQKQTLMNILLERRPASAQDEQNQLSLGDKVLIDVVANWGDNRFAKFLLDRLQSSVDEPYFVSELMSTIAKALSDESLEKIATKYSDISYQDDADLVEDEDAASSTDEGRNSSGESKAEAKESEVVNSAKAYEEAAPAKMTYKQLRADLLNRFIDQSLVAIAIADSTQDEKASR